MCVRVSVEYIDVKTGGYFWGEGGYIVHYQGPLLVLLGVINQFGCQAVCHIIAGQWEHAIKDENKVKM